MNVQLRLFPHVQDPAAALEITEDTLARLGSPGAMADVDLCTEAVGDLRPMASLPPLRRGWELEVPPEEFDGPVDMATLLGWTETFPGRWEAWWFGRLSPRDMVRVLGRTRGTTLWAYWPPFPSATLPGSMVALALDLDGPPLLQAAVISREGDPVRRMESMGLPLLVVE